MRVVTVRDLEFGSPGGGPRLPLPAGALCVAVKADNLPPADPPQFWLRPLFHGTASGWPWATELYAASPTGPGCLATSDDFREV